MAALAIRNQLLKVSDNQGSRTSFSLAPPRERTVSDENPAAQIMKQMLRPTRQTDPIEKGTL